MRCNRLHRPQKETTMFQEGEKVRIRPEADKLKDFWRGRPVRITKVLSSFDPAAYLVVSRNGKEAMVMEDEIKAIHADKGDEDA